MNKEQLPPNWAAMTKWQRRVWRYPDLPEKKRLENQERRKDPENIRRRAEYYQANKVHLDALNNANRDKWWNSLTEDQKVSERAKWAEERRKRRENPDESTKIKAQHKKWRNSEKGKDYLSRPENIQKGRDATNKYRKENPEHFAAYMRNKRATDIQFNLACNLRIRVIQALRGKDKAASTLKLLGCSIAQFKQHLESQFTEGMTLGNYGDFWTIDHIKACSTYDLTDPAQQRLCFHYSNCRPLGKIENMSKGTKSGPPLGQLPLLIT